MINLNLYDPLLYGNGPLGDYTALLSKTWRRSIRRRGGFYVGTAEITQEDLTRPELEEFFRYRLMAELREIGGGIESWRGAIMKMEYLRGNQLFTTDITRMSNAVKVIYTRIFENLLTNGSGESGVWTAYGTPTTVAQSTDWRSDGTYSMHIVTSGGINGAYIQAGIPVVADQAYIIEGRLKLVAGSLRVACNRVDNGQPLAHFSTHGGAPGDYAVSMSIPATNTYTGNVDLLITSEASAIDVYADGFSFRFVPNPNTQTGWFEDAQSISVHGRKENVILEVGKTSNAANAEAQTWLYRWAWPQPFPPTNYTAQLQGAAEPLDRLKITFAGYWATLNWLSVPLGIDTGTMSGLITSLAQLQSTYLSVGSVEVNPTLFAIDNRGALLVGDTIKDIVGDGVAGGQLYSAGVYVNRKFYYLSIPAELTYHLRGGQLYSVSDSLYEPWLAQPGYALWQDLPIGPSIIRSTVSSQQSSAGDQNDPRWVFLEEIEMLPGGQLAYNLEPSL